MIPIPRKVRHQVLSRADGNCEDCGDHVQLELHHLRYLTPINDEHGSASIFGRETQDDLAALCRDCHYNRHIDVNGDFWVDPVDMRDHWSGYQVEMDRE